jgi:general secretion pathway protein J
VSLRARPRPRAAAVMRAATMRGFTLIEVTVALMLLGLIAALLMTSLQFARRSYQKVTKLDTASWETFAAQRALRKLVESAYPLSDPRGRQQGLIGSASRLDVVGAAFLSLEGGGLFRYRVATQMHRDHADLVVRWAPELDAQGFERGTTREEVLLERIVSARWDYCCSRPGSSGDAAREQTWEPSWNEPVMPRRLRLRIEFPQGDSRIWPDLLVAPRVDADANCVFDVVSQACRGGV